MRILIKRYQTKITPKKTTNILNDANNNGGTQNEQKTNDEGVYSSAKSYLPTWNKDMTSIWDRWTKTWVPIKYNLTYYKQYYRVSFVFVHIYITIRNSKLSKKNLIHDTKLH